MDRRESIILTGNLGEEGVHSQLVTQMDKIWESGSEHLEIDMSGVGNVDFNSLTELLRDCNRFLQAGTNAELINIPDHIVKILDFFRVPVNKRS